MKKVRVLIEIGDSGGYSAYMPDDNHLPYGIHGDGASVEEAKADFLAVYDAMKEGFEEDGEKFVEIEPEFSFDVPSFLAYYGRLLSYNWLSKLTGISTAQISQYARGYRKPSPKTTAKIQDALHTLGKELCELKLV